MASTVVDVRLHMGTPSLGRRAEKSPEKVGIRMAK